MADTNNGSFAGKLRSWVVDTDPEEADALPPRITVPEISSEPERENTGLAGRARKTRKCQCTPENQVFDD